LEFLREAINNPGDDCIEWPYGTTRGGYGSVWLKGSKHRAHRVALILYSGETPTPGIEVAHSVECHNPACINPRHLRFATSKENHADKRLNGTHREGEKVYLSKLTEVSVLAIRADPRAHHVIAEDYGVSQSQVSRIKKKKTWAHVASNVVNAGRRRGTDRPGAKLTDADIIAIRADPRRQRIIAADYGVRYQTIGSIKRREKWSHI
jgi:hypothetical protein